jgi:hypothetical protein
MCPADLRHQVCRFSHFAAVVGKIAHFMDYPVIAVVKQQTRSETHD